MRYARLVVNARGGIAIDAGANIGNHSVFFGTFITPHVICFEPNPKVLPILRRNLVANGVDALPYPVGLADAEGVAAMALEEHHRDNVGATRLAPSDGEGAASVPLKRLDDLMPEIRARLGAGARVALLKVDVEGMEEAVLRGAGEMIATDRPDIFAETQEPADLARLLAFLGPRGYRKVASFAATPTWHFVPAERFYRALAISRAFWLAWTARRVWRRLVGVRGASRGAG
ncbi:MAG: hypothetical protein BGP12_07040 [Rhodospirillales bacterium 70-18]|nr:MAG: hypothetical protein BGP12_07040 [Rhodospirillales bacterium 70-18]